MNSNGVLLQMVTQSYFFCHLQNLNAHKMSAMVLDYRRPRTNFLSLTKESFSDAFIISILLLICFLSAEVCEAKRSLARGDTQQKQNTVGSPRLYKK